MSTQFFYNTIPGLRRFRQIDFDTDVDHDQMVQWANSVRHDPHVRLTKVMLVAGPALALVSLVLVLRNIPVALGLSIILAGQIASLNGRYIARSIWATCTLSVRRSASRGELQRENPEDRARVDDLNRTYALYAMFLHWLIPATLVLNGVLLLLFATDILQIQFRIYSLLPWVITSLAGIYLGMLTVSIIFTRKAVPIVQGVS